MPRKAFRVVAEITVDSILSPGSWLPNRDDVYLTLELFGEVKRTRLTDPVFPLIFHERFVYEKVFWSAYDPQEVADLLEEEAVVLELRQVTDVYLGGTLLSYYDNSARDFLYPLPSLSPSMTRDREALMTRTIDFPGVCPKIEFSTYTIIRETTTPYLDSIDDAFVTDSGSVHSPVLRHSRSGSPSRLSRSRSRTKSPFATEFGNNYERQTLASTLRSRSPSPRYRALCDEMALADLESSRRRRKLQAPEIRPPFVVRKVKDPIARKPQLHDNFSTNGPKKGKRKHKRARSVSPRRYRAHWVAEPHQPMRLKCDVCNMIHTGTQKRCSEAPLPPSPPDVKVLRETRSRIQPVHEGSRKNRGINRDSDDEEDPEVKYLMRSTTPVAIRRSPSPIFTRPALTYRYSPSLDRQAERIRRRIDDTLIRARSPSPYLRPYSPLLYYYPERLADLEADLIRARRRYYAY